MSGMWFLEGRQELEKWSDAQEIMGEGAHLKPRHFQDFDL